MRAFVMGCRTNGFINKPLQSVPHAFLTMQTLSRRRQVNRVVYA